MRPTDLQAPQAIWRLPSLFHSAVSWKFRHGPALREGSRIAKKVCCHSIGGCAGAKHVRYSIRLISRHAIPLCRLPQRKADGAALIALEEPRRNVCEPGGYPRRLVQQLLLPCLNLVRVDLVALRQVRHRRLLSRCPQCDRRRQRCIDLPSCSFRHDSLRLADGMAHAAIKQPVRNPESI